MWPYMFSDKAFSVGLLARNGFQIRKIQVWIIKSFEVNFLIFVGGAGGGAPVWGTRPNRRSHYFYKNDRIGLKPVSNKMVLNTYLIVRTTFCDLTLILELQYDLTVKSLQNCPFFRASYYSGHCDYFLFLRHASISYRFRDRKSPCWQCISRSITLGK